MKQNFSKMDRTTVQIDLSKRQGPFEGWRHSLGHGAVNSEPLPDSVVRGIGRLKPRLVRVFLQEYFTVYPEHGVFDWSRLDPYMDAIASTGAKVLATINIKPPVLFPKIDQTIWKPNNVEEWQEVIFQLVRRYSVEKPIVTHWEHANEPDIGETGGCPYLMSTAQDNYAFYLDMVEPVLKAFPEARVGGPALSNYKNPIFKEFVELCHKNRTPLDFVSWHCYHDSTEFMKEQVEAVRQIVQIYGQEKQPELMLNEMNKGFDYSGAGFPSYDLISVEEQALQSRRAAFLTAAILDLADAGIGWSHYFLIWDCCMHPGEFLSFFSGEGIRNVMYRHWNECPTRFGLFSQSGAVRPQYFVYRMLGGMEGEKVSAACEDGDVKAQAVCEGGRLSVIATNYSTGESRELVATFHFTNLKPGVRKLNVYRLDNDRRWDPEKLDLIPVDTRLVDVLPEFSYQVYCPADSVVMMTLEEKGKA